MFTKKCLVKSFGFIPSGILFALALWSYYAYVISFGILYLCYTEYLPLASIFFLLFLSFLKQIHFYKKNKIHSYSCFNSTTPCIFYPINCKFLSSCIQSSRKTSWNISNWRNCFKRVWSIWGVTFETWTTFWKGSSNIVKRSSWKNKILWNL